VRGGKYIVSFFLKTNTGATNVNSFTAQFNGQTLLNLTNSGLAPYTHYSFLAAASSSSTVLQFGGLNNPSWYYLDDVFVEQVARFMAPQFLSQMGHTLMDFQTTMQARSDGMGSNSISTFPDVQERPMVLISEDSEGPSVSSVRPYEAWIQGIGDLGSVTGDSNSPSVTKVSAGLATGLEAHPNRATRAGIAFEYLRSDISVSHAASGAMDTYALGLYGAHKMRGLIVDAAASAAYDTTDDQSNGAQDTSNGYGLGASAGVRYPLRLGSAMLEPRVGLDYAYSYQNGSTYTDPAVQTVTADTGQSFLRSTIGARLSRGFVFGGGWLTPEVRTAWAHQILNPVATVQETIPAVSPASFGVMAPNPGRDAILFALGTSYVVDSFDLFISYNASLSASASDNSVIGGLRFSW
jgi:outer membrane autotransporter protein